jgi:hypothetical protein
MHDEAGQKRVTRPEAVASPVVLLFWSMAFFAVLSLSKYDLSERFSGRSSLQRYPWGILNADS